MNLEGVAREPMRGRARLRVETDDAAHAAAFDEAAALVLRAMVAVPPFGAAAGERDGAVTVDASARIAAAALLLGDSGIATATLHAFAAAHRVTGSLPARLDAPAPDDAGAADAPADAHVTHAAHGDTRARAGSFAQLAARHLAATGDRALIMELWPMLGSAPDSPALRALAEAIGAAPAAGARLVNIASPAAGSAPAGSDPLRPAQQPQHELRGAIAAAAFIMHTVEDLFGFRPDAARQRVELRPCLPGAWSYAVADELVVGDAALCFTYRRSREGVIIGIRQTAGAVPLSLVLVAALPLREVHTVHIDGVAAQLDLGRAADRITLPVQLYLDTSRELAIGGTS
jgi:hypothetical protein